MQCLGDLVETGVAPLEPRERRLERQAPIAGPARELDDLGEPSVPPNPVLRGMWWLYTRPACPTSGCGS